MDIAEDHRIGDRQTIYRHAHATGLWNRRRRNLRAALESLIEGAGCEKRDSLGCIGLASFEVKTVEFEKKKTNYKTSSLVPVHKRMVANHARRIKGCHFDAVRGTGIEMVLARSRYS